MQRPVQQPSACHRPRTPLERLSYLDTLASVRAFYLDLAEWALDDPSRWGPWVAPCPVRAEDLERRKFTRRRKARMDARTRDRLPVLPILTRAALQWRDDAGAVLAAARDTEPGQRFTAAGQILTRSARPHGAPGNIWAHDPATGKQRFLNLEEDHAFWAWAIIEVLRLTGIRVEELTELSHHSLVQYRLPDTGELVPLLQIAPSKTDAERLLVVSPELADVLGTIICRIRGRDGAVPLVRARDRHELIWMPPSPLLFQRRTRTENHAININLVADLLDKALARTRLTDPATGGPLRFTPHDFRRLFITDAVLNGLPPHIAQVIAGHQDISVTMGYKAVYPDEAIRSHLAFLARRRALRPSEEYRTPTDAEWAEFLGTSNAARSPPAFAAARSAPRASTNTAACDAACTGPTLPSGPASPRSATTSSPASPKPNAKAGPVKSKDSRSASPGPKANSPRSTGATPARWSISASRHHDNPAETTRPRCT